MKITQFITAALSGAALLTAGITANAHNDDNMSNRNRVITLSAKASKLIANDEMHATLYIEEQNSNSAALARNLTQAMNGALKQAKQYPKVTATTGSQSTYPMYYKNGKIRGWQGRTEIELRSKNFEQTGRLIAELQQTFKLGNINFRVSEETRVEAETQLMSEASIRFQQRAQSLLSAWNATRYDLISLSLNTSGSYNQPMYAGRAEMAVTDSSVPTQSYAGGESKITVTANGSVQLK